MSSVMEKYLDVEQAYRELDRVNSQKPRKLDDSALKKYESYFETKCKKSKELILQAQNVIPGGVQHNLSLNHPFPLVMTKAEGAYAWDIDGNQYIDFLQAGGPTLLGSNYQPVKEKIISLINESGPVTGLFSEYEYKLADFVCRHVPSVDMIRMLGSGTEAVMAAVRIARAATRHSKIIKVGGAYHGWSDQLVYDMRAAGTGNSYANGIPEDCYKNTQAVLVNDLDGLEALLKGNDVKGGGTACVIVEPIGPESGTRPVEFGYNQKVRELCDKYGALFIFDEVVTGFRLGLSGAQGYYGVTPDLTVFGKAITGGYPAAGAVGGKKEYISMLAPGISDPGSKVMVGGTLSANPLSCAAGYFALVEMEKTDAPAKAARAGNYLAAGLKRIRDQHNLPFAVYNQASIVHLDAVGNLNYTFTRDNAERLMKDSAERGRYFKEFGMALMASGIITIAASRMYTSLADTDEVIDSALERFDSVFSQFCK